VADAIMLFYDADEADRMFEAAGYEEFEHHIQQATPQSPRAITTVARVPADDEAVDDEAVDDEAADGSASNAPDADPSAPGAE
jgi:demethylmenaquinone methyltransferase/2-methoxy-6-polyprenyl-1,4-benzoquinol methylase